VGLFTSQGLGIVLAVSAGMAVVGALSALALSRRKGGDAPKKNLRK
jgi:hypothetical protein